MAKVKVVETKRYFITKQYDDNDLSLYIDTSNGGIRLHDEYQGEIDYDIMFSSEDARALAECLINIANDYDTTHGKKNENN
jgi:hypothetical protein